MRHRRRRRKLSLVTEHREALLRNLVLGLLEKGRIRTTHARAKEASRFADKLITIARKKSLHARRTLISKLHNAKAAKRLFDDVTPLFDGVNGGYTRVIRYDIRPGDGAQMAILEFTKLITPPVVEEDEDVKKKKKEKKEKKAKKKIEKAEQRQKAALEAEKAEKKAEKAKAEKTQEKEKTAPKEEKKGKTSEKKTEETAEEASQEEPKKGGFLGGLRKFLTGDK